MTTANSSYSIIGICGKKFNGKDTIADYLVNNYEYTKVSFGDPLKCGLQEIFGFTDEQLWGSQKEILDPFWKVTPREMLQYIGTDCFRIKFGNDFPHIGEKLWAMALHKKINVMLSKNITKIVIPDVRFPNEIDVVKLLNGTMFKVVRKNFINCDTHISETLLDKIEVDYVFENNTFEKLYHDIDNIIIGMSKL